MDNVCSSFTHSGQGHVVCWQLQDCCLGYLCCMGHSSEGCSMVPRAGARCSTVQLGQAPCTMQHPLKLAWDLLYMTSARPHHIHSLFQPLQNLCCTQHRSKTVWSRHWIWYAGKERARIGRERVHGLIQPIGWPMGLDEFYTPPLNCGGIANPKEDFLLNQLNLLVI